MQNYIPEVNNHTEEDLENKTTENKIKWQTMQENKYWKMKQDMSRKKIQMVYNTYLLGLATIAFEKKKTKIK